MTFTTSAANQLIYSAAGAMEAAAAGYILLSIVTVSFCPVCLAGNGN